MCKIEIIRMAESLIEVEDLLDDSAAVICMTAIVDISTLNHHKETVSAILLQVAYSSFRHIGKAHSPRDRIYGKIDLP